VPRKYNPSNGRGSTCGVEFRLFLLFVFAEVIVVSTQQSSLFFFFSFFCFLKYMCIAKKIKNQNFEREKNFKSVNFEIFI
jgi:hypothetical protein